MTAGRCAGDSGATGGTGKRTRATVMSVQFRIVSSPHVCGGAEVLSEQRESEPARSWSCSGTRAQSISDFCGPPPIFKRPASYTWLQLIDIFLNKTECINEK